MTGVRPRDLPDLIGVPLSDEQLAAATAPASAQLIVAGAGTGKTTVMAARAVWLVASGQARPHDILGLTFTNKAAAELRGRIRSALARLPGTTAPHADEDDDGDVGDAVVSTYHAFAGRLLADYGALVGVEADSRTLTDGQRARLAYAVACRPVTEPAAGSPGHWAERLLGLDDATADLDIDLADLRAYDAALLDLLTAGDGPDALRADMVRAAAERLLLADLVAQFRSEKHTAELLDFSDQVRLAAELARECPSVGAAVRARHPIVMLDEYQDTSRAQRRLLQSLFGDGHAVTAVGDPCQAIYGWRGASVTNIDRFPEQFRSATGAPAQVHRLTVNRRSLPGVLAVANDIATGLRDFHSEVRPLVAPPDRSGGRLACALLADRDTELVWLGDRLAAARDRHRWHDMAVLCRSNDDVAAVVSHLSAVGIPAHVSSRRDLLALPEIRAVTALLRLLVGGDVNPEVLLHLTGPRWRVGPRDLSVLARRARELSQGSPDPSLLDAVHDPGGPEYRYSPEARERITAFAAELDRLARGGDRSAAEVVAEVVELLAPGLVPIDSARLPASFDGLVALAQQFRSLAGGRSLPDFVAYLEDCRRFGASPEDPDTCGRTGVAVMTMHAAKGLEFPLVALPFLSAGVFPAARGAARWTTSSAALPPVAADEPDPAIRLGFPGSSFTSAGHREYVAACREDDRRDEDRLAYVAATRAQRELLASGHWWGPTQKKPRGPSDYLQAVRRVCAESGGEVGPWLDEPPERDTVLPSALVAPWPPPVAEPHAQRVAAAVAAAGGDTTTPTDAASWGQAVGDLIERRTLPAPAPAMLPEVVSASAVLAWLEDPAAHLDRVRRPMPRRPSAAASRGVAFHEWMERRVGQQTLFELPAPASAAGGTDHGGEFAAALARTGYADRTPHATEHPFVLAVAGLVVTGRIDAVFATPDDPGADWEVVDWKTGRGGEHDPVQLMLYVEAWARISGTPRTRIRATFVNVADGTVTHHDDLPPAADALRALTAPDPS